MASACVRKCCTIFSGRRVRCTDGSPPLLPGSCGGGEVEAAASSEAAARALKQLQAVRQRCEALCPEVERALASMPLEEGGSGEAALTAIRERLADLEELLLQVQGCRLGDRRRGSRQARGGRSSGGREAVTCLASQGEDTRWTSGRVTIAPSGLSLDVAPGEQQQVQSLPWDDVERVDVRGPDSIASSVNSSAAARYEAELVLRRPPGRLRFQFPSAEPTRSIQAMWHAALEELEFSSTRSNASSDQEASGAGASPSVGMTEATTTPTASSPTAREVESCGPLLEYFHTGGGRLTAEVTSVYRTVLTGEATLAGLRALLLREDADSPLARLWRSRNVPQMIVATPWEPMVEGQTKTMVRSLHFMLPLVPIVSIAPNKTRMSIVYCVTGDVEGGGPLVLSEISRGLDVPYSTAFVVQTCHVFREVPAPPGNAGGEANPGVVVEADNFAGILWTGRCMGFIKSIVEKQSKQETIEVSQELVRILCEELSRGAAAAP